MPIYEESRYETAAVVPVEGSDGVFKATIYPELGVPPVEQYTNYLVLEGDRIEALSFMAYGDPEFWWRIADANVDLMSGLPDKLVPGTVIRIPVLVLDF